MVVEKFEHLGNSSLVKQGTMARNTLVGLSMRGILKGRSIYSLQIKSHAKLQRRSQSTANIALGKEIFSL